MTLKPARESSGSVWSSSHCCSDKFSGISQGPGVVGEWLREGSTLSPRLIDNLWSWIRPICNQTRYSAAARLLWACSTQNWWKLQSLCELSKPIYSFRVKTLANVKVLFPLPTIPLFFSFFLSFYFVLLCHGDLCDSCCLFWQFIQPWPLLKWFEKFYVITGFTMFEVFKIPPFYLCYWLNNK